MHFSSSAIINTKSFHNSQPNPQVIPNFKTLTLQSQIGTGIVDSSRRKKTMSAAVCGSKRSFFEELPPSPPLSKRLRCSSSSSPNRFSAPSPLDHLRSVFPHMDIHVILFFFFLIFFGLCCCFVWFFREILVLV